MNVGRNTIGQLLGDVNVSALVNRRNSDPKPGGITIDVAFLTAEAASRPLLGGISTVIGDKVIPLGTVMYKHSSGLYRIASDVTPSTLLMGETFVTATHWFSSIHEAQFGDVHNVGQFKLDCLRAGGAGQPTLANVLAATRIRTQGDV